MEPVQITEKVCRSALNRSGIPGMDYCLNPYTGCAHACVYCYACFMKRFTGVEAPWGSFVQVKTNFAERLQEDLRRLRRGGTVMLASVTDAYQPLEAEYGLTRAALELLIGSALKVSILTKSDLVLRDMDLLLRLPGAEVGFTLTVADDNIARYLEPGAPPPSRRLAAMATLVQAGIPTWTFIAPVIPGIGDTPENLEALLEAIVATGTPTVHFDPLNFYPSAVANLHRLLARHFPRSLPAFQEACRDQRAYRAHLQTLATALWPACGLRSDPG
ncbi:MAG: radical SAM protein [Clostridia bacterium]|nr:MAG: radical SAM protein [Clostridia bacterium]